MSLLPQVQNTVPSLDPLSLLEPIAGGQPCGRNLDYTPELLALEAAAQEPEEPGIKDVVAVDTRNWRDVVSRAENLLRESKDIRVAVLLARGVLQTEGLAAFCTSLTLLKGFVERFWEAVYPPLEEDGNDAVMRLNALRELWSPTMLAALRSTPLVEVRGLGQFSLHDVLVAKGVQKPRAGVTPPSPTHVLKALEELSPELLTRVEAALEDVKLLELLVRQKAGDSYAFDASPLRDLLFRVAQVLKEHGRSPLTATSAGLPESTDGLRAASLESGLANAQGHAMEGASMHISGEVRSRDDVVQLLDKIVAYYERQEPSSPVPLLMHRAKRLATMNFLEIMRDLADKGLPQVEAITGKEAK